MEFEEELRAVQAGDTGYQAGDYDILRRLVRTVAKPGMICFEVGTYAGRSALSYLPIIAENGGHLYCVDWFCGNKAAKGGVHGYRPQDKSRIMAALVENVRKARFENHVTIMAGKSADAARIIMDNVADFSYIAADHTYSAVSEDIRNWLRITKPGGILAGHAMTAPSISVTDPQWQTVVIPRSEEDCSADGKHWGVFRAVTEAFGNKFNRESIFWWIEVAK